MQNVGQTVHYLNLRLLQFTIWEFSFSAELLQLLAESLVLLRKAQVVAQLVAQAVTGMYTQTCAWEKHFSEWVDAPVAVQVLNKSMWQTYKFLKIRVHASSVLLLRLQMPKAFSDNYHARMSTLLVRAHPL